MKTRIYKYAIHPTPMQLSQLEQCGRLTKFLWNRLVKYQRYAHHEIKHGRRATIENEFLALMRGKELVGMRAKGVSDKAIELGISQEEALKLMVKTWSEKDTTIPISKKTGGKSRWWAARHLSWRYALEKVNSERIKLLRPDQLSIWTGIQAKWNDFGQSWDKGIHKDPKFKKYGQTSAIQKQISKSTKWKLDKYVDLSWCGSPCLEKVEVNVHRQLPHGATIKQIALVKNPKKAWYICVFIKAKDEVFQRKFTQTGKVVGIDPGVKAALTTSDGKIYQPDGLSNHERKEAKLKRLCRKLDRQTRACNPHCYNEKGEWIRGKRIIFRSKKMLQTAFQITRIKSYFKDAKSNYYHHLAIKLLNQYDTIGIGGAKMHELVKGEGKQKRTWNTKVREHALSEFVAIISDKASLSLTPKFVCGNIDEKNTTRMCSCCGALTGPTDLSIREWICSNCGTKHVRDVNSAKNIELKTLQKIANEAGSQFVSGRKSKKVRGLTKVNETRSTETTSPQGGGVTQETLASSHAEAQPPMDSRNLYVAAIKTDTKVNGLSEPSSPSEKTGCSQSQTCTTATKALVKGPVAVDE